MKNSKEFSMKRIQIHEIPQQTSKYQLKYNGN